MQNGSVKIGEWAEGKKIKWFDEDPDAAHAN